VPLLAALVAAAVLVPVHLKVARPMLLLERFAPGWGWLELAALVGWAAFVARRMADPRAARRWRPRLWRLFSAVFFAQLLLGLAGAERFLMTGALHPPVPALILAGPAYRGGGWFMVGLLASTLVLVGPAWCSHLCYIGAWDDAAARARRSPMPLPAWARLGRPLALVVTVGGALALRALGASGGMAAALGGAFGLGGVAVMVLASRRLGTMAHCTAWCPIGWVTALAGRLHPLRVRFGAGCTDCLACTAACRFDALSPDDVKRRRVGASCTLCGDCVGACRHSSLAFSFPGLSARGARRLFLVLVVGLHAAFLGLARI
jgi:polyferredoxin